MCTDHFLAAHEGYMDGLLGNEPKSDHEDYETGWLHGMDDKGKVDPALFKTSIERGDTVLVPKDTELLYDEGIVKRATKVKLHDVYSMVPAHIDHTRYRNGLRHQEFFVKPKPPIILWAGSGGYWKRTYAHQVTKVEP